MDDVHTKDLNTKELDTNDLNAPVDLPKTSSMMGASADTNDLDSPAGPRVTEVEHYPMETEPHVAGEQGSRGAGEHPQFAIRNRMDTDPYLNDARPYPADGVPYPGETVPYGEAPIRGEDKGKRRSYVWGLITILLIFALISFAVVGSLVNRFSDSTPELPPSRAGTPIAMPSPTDLSNSFRGIARSVKPAVVNINVIETVSQDSSFSDIFGFGGPRRRPGTGSGFIVTEDGYILTNHHVVGNADRIEVTLSDGRKFKGTLVGTDPESDIALIRVEGEGFPTVALGDSDAVEQGDWVLALGSPFGLQQTLTAGIVSATGRELSGAGTQYSRFIQTDASINPGNSGGPLVNMSGEVIGINTLIFSQTGTSNGVGFSIASNVVRAIFTELAKNGKVTRGYLGVTIQPLAEPIARAYGLEPNSGVLVAGINGSDSPAGKAGLNSGDIITAFDGKKVRAPRELTDAVAATPVGKSVRVDFIRDGQSRSVNIKVSERPIEISANRAEPERTGEQLSESTRLGISAQTVTPEIADRLKLSISSGALVQSVGQGTPASDAGLRRGDVIHRIDRVEVRSVDDIVEAVKSLPSGEVALQIERNGQMAFVIVTID